MHEMSKDEQLKADRGGGRVIVGEWSGALNPCASSSRMLASSSKEKADTGRLGLCRRRGSMSGSQGGEADEKERAFVRAQLEVRWRSLVYDLRTEADHQRLSLLFCFRSSTRRRADISGGRSKSRRAGMPAGRSRTPARPRSSRVSSATRLPAISRPIGTAASARRARGPSVRRPFGLSARVASADFDAMRLTGSHTAYWNQAMGNKASRMENDRFNDGFTVGVRFPIAPPLLESLTDARLLLPRFPVVRPAAVPPVGPHPPAAVGVRDSPGWRSVEGPPAGRARPTAWRRRVGLDLGAGVRPGPGGRDRPLGQGTCSLGLDALAHEVPR
jgi:hypothetical protein